ncbi:MAG: type II toxin-antitoxin system death-on-curing family toxin [Prochloraceae cyanobacterium]|nr:type II toxin-antitoxin system death-on-curing family toxin [Prochloraceae cyanobacterium]
MTRYLTQLEVLELHRQLIERWGGLKGLRDNGALESALAQPRMTFGSKDLYPTLVDKASVLGFSLIVNHPFLDGNKRTGHAAMETFLILNGFEIDADTNEQEKTILAVAAGELNREGLTKWLKAHIKAVN